MFMDSGFRILDFSTKLFSKDNIHIDFFENKQLIETNSFSCALIVGENGCGKTELLVNILKAFCEIEEYIKHNATKKTSKNKAYSLKYYLNDNIYEIEKDKEYTFKFKKNGIVIDNYSEIELPSCFIAQSFSFADKFNYNSEGRYYYLGTRTASNVSYVSHIENSIVDIICTKMEKEGFNNFIKILLDFLGFDHKIDVFFQVESLRKLNITLNDKSQFMSMYDEFINSNRRISSDFREIFLNFKAEFVYEKILNILNGYNKNYKKIEYNLNLSDMINYYELKDFFIFMRILSYMKILSTPKVNFYKHQDQFPVESSSSGEKQIIYSLLNIYSVIRPNSLVIIDEPEISLHPNWQMKYMKLLEEMFSKYTDSHFLIATHSHFMVSDLKKENSAVIVMNRSSNIFNTFTYDSDTYSWSAEDILYNVFSVPSSRNFYVASDIEKVVAAISTEDISDDIKNKIRNFKRIYPNLKDSDPLKAIIQMIMDKGLV